MYCKTCKRFDTVKAEKCSYCGSTDVEKELPRRPYTNKHTLAVFMSLFLGALGLIIGLLVFKKGDERETFIEGWIVGYFALVILSLIFGVPLALILFF